MNTDRRSVLKFRWLLVPVLMLMLSMVGCQQIEQPNEPPWTEGVSDTSVSSEMTTRATTEIVTEEASEESLTETQEQMSHEEEDGYYSDLGKNSLFWEIPEYPFDIYLEHRNMGDAEMLIFEEAKTDEGYLQYMEILDEAGCELYAKNQIKNSHYSTWLSGETTVTAIYINGYSRVHLIAEETGGLPGLLEDNVYNDYGVENLVAQIGADYDGTINNGMCYVYRLCDGSFLIVDSGHEEDGCADALYETLCRLAPDPEHIVIAAWFLTHAHGDHMGGFIRFSDKYADRVTLEQVIYNYPNAKSFRDSGAHLEWRVKTERVCEYYEGLKVIEAHPGQRFYIRDAEIEMLFTWDLLKSEITYFNNTSLVLTIDLDGERIMQLGDCGPLASETIALMYGAYLKSDIVQVSHHGYKGASSLLYRWIDADVALWPTTKANYEKYKGAEYNRPLQESEVIYLADREVTVIPLPYDGENVQSWSAYEE